MISLFSASSFADGSVTAFPSQKTLPFFISARVSFLEILSCEEIILSIRTREGNYRLLLSASASNPRLHLTTVQRENPMTPPMLCMLMRKHLCGGVITDITQRGFDRVVKLDIETRDELGDICVKSVIVEIMGRHSNVILVDENNKIMDSAKHIDFSVSGHPKDPLDQLPNGRFIGPGPQTQQDRQQQNTA